MMICRGNLIFIVLIAILLTRFISLDFIKHKAIEINPRYTVGFVTDYNQFVRIANKRIEYQYQVKGKVYRGEFRSNEIPIDQKGKRIVIKFSNAFRGWNLHLYNDVVVDSILVPTEGWKSLPDLIYH